MAQRGVRFYTLLQNDEQSNKYSASQNKRNGRNPVLLEKRNNFLLYRLYFKSKVEGKNYENAFSELENEVYLSAFMIQKIMQQKQDELLSIKREKPTAKELRSMFPHVLW